MRTLPLTPVLGKSPSACYRQGVRHPPERTVGTVQLWPQAAIFSVRSQLRAAYRKYRPPLFRPGLTDPYSRGMLFEFLRTARSKNGGCGFILGSRSPPFRYTLYRSAIHQQD